MSREIWRRINPARRQLTPVFPSKDQLPKLDKVDAVRDVAEKLIADVYAGRVHPRVAAGLAPLLNLQLRVVQATDFERRLAQLEKLARRTQGGSARVVRENDVVTPESE